MDIFISYRRADAPSAARQLADALKTHRVFLDTRDLAPGVQWRDELRSRITPTTVVLAVIGPHWADVAEARGRAAMLNAAADDVMRLELETAFRQARAVIPVLVDDARMPGRDELPRPFRPLAALQAVTLRHASWERDTDALIATLDALPPPSPRVTAPPAVPGPAPRGDPADRVASYVARGTVALILGSGANTIDRHEPWRQDSQTLPDAAELARHLGRQFGLDAATDDLAEVSEHVSLSEGRVDLCRMLRDLLVRRDSEPSSLHRFVAGLPRRLRELGCDAYPLVVTTNYDAGLERAFDAIHEPYDLVLFSASGQHRGRFVHLPWWDPDTGGAARPITVPNEYVELPIDEEGELHRALIVKLNGGAADLGPSGPPLRDNFVVTEDDYISYLTSGPVESLVPLQILNKLRDSHCLFLGYRMRDWSLRVVLQRIWVEQQIEARSWAVQPDLELVERRLWDQFGVDVVEQPLGEFVAELDRALEQLPRALSEP